jgi:hypothetical protein
VPFTSHSAQARRQFASSEKQDRQCRTGSSGGQPHAHASFHAPRSASPPATQQPHSRTARSSESAPSLNECRPRAARPPCRGERHRRGRGPASVHAASSAGPADPSAARHVCHTTLGYARDAPRRPNAAQAQPPRRPRAAPVLVR